MSPTLLTKRLRTLEDAGVVARVEEPDGRPAYEPTEAGRELLPVLVGLGRWGRRWVGRELRDEDLDAALLMWDMRRRIDVEALPRSRTCLFFHFVDAPSAQASFWLRIDEAAVDVCLSHPGDEVELEVRTDVRTMTEVWLGMQPVSALAPEGAADLRRTLGDWLGLGMFSDPTIPP